MHVLIYLSMSMYSFVKAGQKQKPWGAELQGLRHDVDQRLDAMHEQVEGVKAELSAQLDSVNGKLDQLLLKLPPAPQ